MIKNTLLILSLLLLAVKSNAQQCGYKEYYPLSELARENYSVKDYKAAEQNIKLAFEKVEFPLGAELHLALSIAKKLNNSQWAQEISIQLAKGGVPLRYFRYLRKYDWFEKFKADFETYSNYYKENFKPELRDKLNALIIKDKAFNGKYHDWRTRKIELTLDDLIKGATEVTLDFNDITYEYGFPNEKLTGYNYVRRTDRIENFRSDVLIIHIYQRGTPPFKDQLNQIVCAGGLHPNYAKTLKGINGYGNSTGIEQEMKVRYTKYRGDE